ncbi:MAG: InlB B-repeat-containing protein [Lachnospiraceae bacterium]|nr:InlB B-repeat-containing protein [Lachnospiraceae bacterium]
MSNKFRRLLSLVVTLALILGLLPSVAQAAGSISAGSKVKASKVYSEAENTLLDNDVFAKISEVTAGSGTAQIQGGVSQMTEADYIAILPEVVSAIKSSDTYVEGSLQQNGNFLVWQTTTGIPCCYDPRMEAELHNTSNQISQAELMSIEADAEALFADLRSTASVNSHTPSSVEIGLIQPYYESSSSYADSSFKNYSPYYKSMWQSLYAATGGSSSYRYTMTNATIDNIAKTIQNCALVIMDSHGTTDYSGSNGDYTSKANCSYLCLTTNTGITSTDTAAKTGTYGTYYDCLKGSGYAYVSGQCIANHMTSNAPGSLVYMGICLGMATDGMYKGLRAKGVEAVYGYSQSVSFTGEKQYMQSILGYIKDGDTLADALSKTKSSLGSWDPAYSSYSLSQAKSNKVAFPIVVSSEDTYPGHGNVDAVQTVYSTWQLFGGSSTPSYTVSATSNNTSYGTVSVSGNTITASPKTGYYVSGYQVTSGSATVTQSGNTFTVTPASDCTVQIIFAAKQTVKVTYVANGATYTTATVYAGDSVTVPTAATAVDGWTFAGWATGTVAETTSKPTYYAPGATYTPSANTTLYAVYTKTEGGSGANVYELVTSAPSTWAGNYVITYGTSSSSMYVMKGLSGSTKYESTSAGGAVALASTGITLSGSQLSDVSDAYIFNVASSSGKYAIKNASTGTYLASKSSYLYSYTSLSSSYCLWNLAMNGSAVSASNSASSTYPYLSFSSSKYFMINRTASSSIYFWKQAAAGTTYYATSPSTTTVPDDPTPTEPETTFTVSFTVPSGVSAVASKTCTEGSSITLPTAGAPSGYTFLGWVAADVNNATAMPSQILTGSYTPTGNITLKALYAYTTSTGVTGYQLVTSAPSDWSGSYVITYGNTASSLYALKGLSGNVKYESTSAGGATAYASTGMTLSGNTLTNVSPAYVFTISSYSGKYSIKNAQTGTYLASRSSYLYSYTTLSSSYCKWSFAMNGTAVKATNTASSRYPYLSFSSSKYFMINSSASAGIYFWKQTSAAGGTTYYTTIID